MGIETKTIQVGADFLVPKTRTGGPGVNGAVIDRMLDNPGTAEFIPIGPDPAYSEDPKSKWQGRAKSIRGILSKAAQARKAQVHSSLVVKGVAGGKQLNGLGARDFGVLAYAATRLTEKTVNGKVVLVNSDGVQIYGLRKNKKSTPATTETPSTPAPSAPTTGSRRR